MKRSNFKDSKSMIAMVISSYKVKKICPIQDLVCTHSFKTIVCCIAQNQKNYQTQKNYHFLQVVLMINLIQPLPKPDSIVIKYCLHGHLNQLEWVQMTQPVFTSVFFSINQKQHQKVMRITLDNSNKITHTFDTVNVSTTDVIFFSLLLVPYRLANLSSLRTIQKSAELYVTLSFLFLLSGKNVL